MIKTMLASAMLVVLLLISSQSTSQLEVFEDGSARIGDMIYQDQTFHWED